MYKPMTKAAITEIKKFVNDKFNPQGVEISVNYGGNNKNKDSFAICLMPENRDGFNWGRTLVELREKFTKYTFWRENEKLNDDNFETPLIYFIVS